jgi:glycerol-3-phosphate dehydrogenase
MTISRSALLEQARDGRQWDVVVVGGGATGLGSALDAAARGYSTLLLEAADFAKGTSSRSTKLVHGGVRYLAQGNIKLVREALYERGLLRRNAPHLVHALEFVVPSYNWWYRPYYGLGLTLYDVLSGKLGIGHTRIIGREEAIEKVPTIEPEGLRGGVTYFDGQFDDTRLAVTLLLTLIDQGGVALNYAPVTGLIKENGRVAGVVAHDAETGESLRINAKVVVNATGVFADGLRKMDDPQARAMLAPSQGIHMVLDQEFMPGQSAIMIPRTDDGRVLFAIPWHGKVVVGTTDTAVEKVQLEPRPLEQEIEFLLEHAARYLTKDPAPSDVRSMFAGLRPLVKAGDGMNSKELPRDHTLLVSPSKLVTITGGKWTTYRRMAEDTINKAAEVGGLAAKPSTTKDLRLHGALEVDLEAPLAVYGSQATALQALCNEQPGWNEPLHPDLPYLAGEVVWAARNELARTVEDVLSRRTRALLLDARASIAAAPRVAELMAAELGHDASWSEAQVRAYRTLAEQYLLQGAAHGDKSGQEESVAAVV